MLVWASAPGPTTAPRARTGLSSRQRPQMDMRAEFSLQAAVAAALALVDANALGSGAPVPTDGPARALEFAAERLADGRATAPPGGLLRVLAYIALGPWPADAQVKGRMCQPA